ncbi:protein translocase subunit SecF [Paenibacillus senegalensis]|uniref:protein translocase subunit SecF n=1 Tax=Paenibacillus senegalensis TaxID=1465766 RepID=UPI00028857D2|nr:protein translocase subunit SecF [Paenibacillus senegalensis]
MRFNHNISLVKHRNKIFIIAIILTLIGVASLSLFGLNRGVDFKSGTSLDIMSAVPVEREQVDKIFAELGYDIAPTVGETMVSARFDRVLNQDEVVEIVTAFEEVYGQGNITREENTVDIELARELAMKGIYTVLIASVGIALYVSVRFEWRFALASIVGLLHAAFIVITLFSIFRWEVNLPFIAAMLTVVGYAINDTIVVFDRIRDNLRFAKIKSLQDLENLVNRSLWESMARSINTGITVLFAAVALLIFGSETIRYFSLAITLGLILGIYATLFIASPLWLVLKHKWPGNTVKKQPVPAKEQ